MAVLTLRAEKNSWEKGVKLFHYDCRFDSPSLFYITWGYSIRCIDAWHFYIFLRDWVVQQYELSSLCLLFSILNSHSFPLTMMIHVCNYFWYMIWCFCLSYIFIFNPLIRTNFIFNLPKQTIFIFNPPKQTIFYWIRGVFLVSFFFFSGYLGVTYFLFFPSGYPHIFNTHTNLWWHQLC